jgi:multicomponent Na+:H+ antiporter subunit B
MNSIIFTAGARILVALLLVFSLFMLLRGHHLPGGGFIGGLIGAMGSSSIRWPAARPRRARRCASARRAGHGGAWAWRCWRGCSSFFGDPFFTGQWYWVGGDSYETAAFSVNTVLVFDIGVYLVVLGGILSLAYAFEEET